uniref:AAA+ ATPase domain-containing protein n=1 Tax=Sciurus vulgaris TaxID=55149 RepID=A0A8D2AV88_SCIVU
DQALLSQSEMLHHGTSGSGKRIKDYLLMEEEFIRNQEQMKLLEEKQEEERSKVDDLRGTPMSVGTLEEIIDDNHAIVSTSVGSEHYVSILSFVDKDLLEPGCSVLLSHKVHAMIGVLMDDTDPLVTVMNVEKAPQETYADIGGLDNQIEEIKESVELPLTHPEYYEEMGRKPPKGVILYGPPGTGKILLAKAVANQTSATFLRVVGSELIQKYLGDGPKLLRELFRVAEEHAPSIVFIDEIDAIGTKRYDSNSGGKREIQRTMLELLNQLDGFDSRGDVKVIMATNRIETLDPALIRPGRIDRKIEFPLTPCGAPSVGHRAALCFPIKCVLSQKKKKKKKRNAASLFFFLNVELHFFSSPRMQP